MPGRMPEDMPDRMPEDMSDRMPEDLPVTKCINVMVGITRSKVITCFYEDDWLISARAGSFSTPRVFGVLRSQHRSNGMILFDHRCQDL
jgi:hypothetical protein